MLIGEQVAGEACRAIRLNPLTVLPGEGEDVISIIPRSQRNGDFGQNNGLGAWDMANEQYAFLQKTAVPARDQWQAVIEACGFDFQLDPGLKPFENSGFLPCKLFGADAGFEIYYDGSPEMLSEFADIAQGRDYCISFRWGGSMVECASAMIASYALAKDCGAIVSYEGEEPYHDLDAFLSDTMACIEDARKGS